MSTEIETTTTQKKGVLYELTDAGVITRHDTRVPGAKPVGIAAFKDGKVRWSHPDFVRLENQVKGLLRHRGITDFEIMPYEERPPIVRDAVLISPPVVAPPPEPPPQDLDGPDGMRQLSVEQRKAVNYLRSKEGFAIGELERPAPPAPETTSGAGDKTPAFTTWLLRYHPKRFVETYGVIGMGAIEVTVPGKIDPETGMLAPATRKWEHGHALARRATIYTDLAPTTRKKEDEE